MEVIVVDKSAKMPPMILGKDNPAIWEITQKQAKARVQELFAITRSSTKKSNDIQDEEKGAKDTVSTYFHDTPQTSYKLVVSGGGRRKARTTPSNGVETTSSLTQVIPQASPVLVGPEPGSWKDLEPSWVTEEVSTLRHQENDQGTRNTTDSLGEVTPQASSELVVPCSGSQQDPTTPSHGVDTAQASTRILPTTTSEVVESWEMSEKDIEPRQRFPHPMDGGKEEYIKAQREDPSLHKLSGVAQ